MKVRYLFLVSFFFMGLSIITAQIDYSKPEVVAEKFLDLYFKGDWFNACKLYGLQDCEDQISFMLKKMMTDEDYVDEGTCTFEIDSCVVDKSQKTAKCYFTKTCSADTTPKKNHLDLKKVDEKWVVEYIYRRDKYL
ncbi:MAG: hypothetical protein M1495_22935 [Bacteroidetes bacterium]|nr:hypothetical protein [Bacteroidota bacterium]